MESVDITPKCRRENHYLFDSFNIILHELAVGVKAKELLNYFVEYLRSNFDFKQPDQRILLEKELHIVTTYLHIEKERFGDRLEIQLDVDDEVLSTLIPAFLLQPLVENAVLHGILKKIEGGIIQVSVKQHGSEIQFRIKDNGVGMTMEQADQLLSTDYESGIGLRNMQGRLQKWYGTGLSIVSELGKGTEVSFSIPAERIEVVASDDR